MNGLSPYWSQTLRLIRRRARLRTPVVEVAGHLSTLCDILRPALPGVIVVSGWWMITATFIAPMSGPQWWVLGSLTLLSALLLLAPPLLRRLFGSQTALGADPWAWEHHLIENDELPWEILAELAFHPDFHISSSARFALRYAPPSAVLTDSPARRLAAHLLESSSSADDLRAGVRAVWNPATALDLTATP